MSRPARRTSAAALLGLASLLAAPAAAQQLDTAVTVASGSGMSMGKGGEEVLTRTSPVFLDVDVGLIFDGDTSMEWTPSLIMELTGRVSVGIAPSLKRVWSLGGPPLSVYAGIGFPFFFAPFTLIGVEPAVGAFYRVLPRLSVVLELHADLFFAGSDLPDGSVLAKLDASLGLRLDL